MALVQLGVRDGSTIDHGLVVAKHKTLITDWDPKITKAVVKINYLVNAWTAGNEFRTVGSSLDGCLLFGVPVNESLVEEMKKSSDGATCKHVMIKVSIKIVSKSDVLAKQSRCVGRNEFGDVATDNFITLKKRWPNKYFKSKIPGRCGKND